MHFWELQPTECQWSHWPAHHLAPHPCQLHFTLPHSLQARPIFVRTPKAACQSKFFTELEAIDQLQSCNLRIGYKWAPSSLAVSYSRVFRGRTVVAISSISSSSSSVRSFFLLGSKRSLILFFGSTLGCFRRDSNVPMPFRGSLVNGF